MNLISRERIATIVSLGLKVQPAYVKTITGKTHGHNLLVEDITSRIMGKPESEAVILKTELGGKHSFAGPRSLGHR